MIVSLIAAVAQNRTIGQGGRLPWHISADLKRFKRLTTGHAVIMGRKTFESIGFPLPGRRNVVLTRNPAGSLPDTVESVDSLAAAFDRCRQAGETEAFVIGGGEVYREALPLADRLYLTWVHRDVAGDTRFPVYDSQAWQETNREDHDGYSFVDYARLKC